MNEDKISQYRAKVIEDAIGIETNIGLAITEHYFGVARADFLVEVILDDYFNVGLKINILKKIFPNEIDIKVENKIRRLMNIRNLFAHNHNIKIYDGEKWVVLNPSDFKSGFAQATVEGKSHRGINFQILYEEFNQLKEEISPILDKLYTIRYEGKKEILVKSESVTMFDNVKKKTTKSYSKTDFEKIISNCNILKTGLKKINKELQKMTTN
jgi:hypothetical protein